MGEGGRGRGTQQHFEATRIWSLPVVVAVAAAVVLVFGLSWA